MDKHLEEIIEYSLRIESGMSSLYNLMSRLFPDDSKFLDRLATEEMNHVKLLQAGKTFLVSTGAFPEGLVAPQIEALKTAVERLEVQLMQYRGQRPDRDDAFAFALDAEQGAGEIHFQLAMEGCDRDDHLQVFRDLNKDDKGHASRLKTYLEKNPTTESLDSM